MAQTYLQLPLQQWGAGNVYLLVLFSWKVNIAKTLLPFGLSNVKKKELKIGQTFVAFSEYLNFMGKILP